jgi:hypothetical protein
LPNSQRINVGMKEKERERERERERGRPYREFVSLFIFIFNEPVYNTRKRPL